MSFFNDIVANSIRLLHSVNNHTSPYQMSKTTKELSPCCKCTAVEGGTGGKAGGTKSNTCRLVHEKEVSSTPRRSRGMYMSKSDSHSTTMRDNIGNRNTTSTILCTSAGGYGGSIFSGRRGGNEQLVVSSLGTRCAHAHGRLGVSGKRTTGGGRENRNATTAKKQGGLSFFVYLICCCYVCSYARYVFALLLSRDMCLSWYLFCMRGWIAHSLFLFITHNSHNMYLCTIRWTKWEGP